ncbi:hypothetical protein BH09PLA1_BH09PLA1_05560 [soil metagenome]
MRIGWLAVLKILGVNIALNLLSAWLLPGMKSPLSIILTGLAILAAQLWAIFAVLRQTFQLSNRRTFAPFGALLGVSAIQLTFALGVLRPFVLEAFVTPTASMSPTLNANDRFVANKLISPRRWDLVVYWSYDREPAQYVKRLVGLPGERLRFDEGGVFINDQPVKVPPVLAGRCRASYPHQRWQEARYHDGDTIVLGADEYFFIGDNIDISADSRISGPSKESALIGVVDWIYWPLRKFRLTR